MPHEHNNVIKMQFAAIYFEHKAMAKCWKAAVSTTEALSEKESNKLNFQSVGLSQQSPQ